MTSEFELIRRFFDRPAKRAVLGVGDDAALLTVADGMELAVSSDMLVSGRHFFPDTDPFQLGYKALAVNLSDMAAMGATPRWATLAIALHEPDERWLDAFSQGFFGLANEFEVDVVGGDTTRGPLTLSVQIMGEVERGRALRRSGARPGDDIWVSGTLGDAALALAHSQHRITLDPADIAALLPALHTPTPRVRLGQSLLGLAHAAIDISDGLLADLGHILERSSCGAEVHLDRLPRSAVLDGYWADRVAREAVLAGGDDYELCFTASPSMKGAIEEAASAAGVRVRIIGQTTTEPGLRVLDEAGREITIPRRGFDHFQ